MGMYGGSGGEFTERLYSVLGLLPMTLPLDVDNVEATMQNYCLSQADIPCSFHKQ